MTKRKIQKDAIEDAFRMEADLMNSDCILGFSPERSRVDQSSTLKNAKDTKDTKDTKDIRDTGNTKDTGDAEDIKQAEDKVENKAKNANISTCKNLRKSPIMHPSTTSNGMQQLLKKIAKEQKFYHEAINMIHEMIEANEGQMQKLLDFKMNKATNDSIINIARQQKKVARNRKIETKSMKTIKEDCKYDNYLGHKEYKSIDTHDGHNDYNAIEMVQPNIHEICELKGAVSSMNKDLSKVQDNLIALNAFIRDEFSNKYNKMSEWRSDDGKNDEYHQALERYFRTGSEAELQGLEGKSAGKFRYDGGYNLSQTMKRDIMSELQNTSIIRGLAYCIEVSNDISDIVTVQEQITACWGDESFDDNDKANETVIAKTSIPICDLYAQPYISQKLLDDPMIPADEILVRKLSIDFARKEEQAFLNGDGKHRPKGILGAINAKSIIKIKDKLTANDLLNLYFTLNARYLPNAKFITNRETMMKIASLMDENKRPLLEYNLSSSISHSLLGLQIYISPHFMNGETAILLGDFANGYTIVDRKQLTVLRDPFTRKKYVKFFATKSVGGGVTDNDAFALLKGEGGAK